MIILRAPLIIPINGFCSFLYVKRKNLAFFYGYHKYTADWWNEKSKFKDLRPFKKRRKEIKC